jgi:general secretion pathway protein B
MSFILDALRKSEHERQRSALPGLAQVPLATPPTELPRWTLVVIGVLVAAVVVLGAAWWQSTRAPAEVAAERTVARPVQLPAPTSTSVAPTAATSPLADRVATLQPPAEVPAADRSDTGLAAAASASSPEPSAAEPSFEPPTADEPALPSAAALAAEGVPLPELRLELHRFREQARERFVFINGRKYVEGDRLAEGPQIVSIVPTGAVLVHSGRRFLLVPE